MSLRNQLNAEIEQLEERIAKLRQLRDLAEELGFGVQPNALSRVTKPVISEEMQKLSRGKSTNAVTQKRTYGKSEEHLARIRNIIGTLTGGF
jgi:hypothetical protein